MTPKISILLPTFNGERYLRESIGSILKQGLTEFEVLLSDDHSSDNSDKIIRSFADSRIKHFHREKNLGLFKNLNLMISEAKAPLVRFFCQDDIMEPDCLEEEADFFSRHPEITISCCKTYRINENGNITGKSVLGDLPETVDPFLAIQCFFYHGCIFGNLSTACARKEVFNRVGLFNESYTAAGDYEMWVRICRQNNLGIIHKHLVRLRSHKKQLSRSAALKSLFIIENRKIRRLLLSYLPPDTHSSARKYAILRQNVLDIHCSMHVLMRGRVRDFLKIVTIMGAADFTLGVIFWLLTLNNHLYRPRPRFAK